MLVYNLAFSSPGSWGALLTSDRNQRASSPEGLVHPFKGSKRRADPPPPRPQQRAGWRGAAFQTRQVHAHCRPRKGWVRRLCVLVAGPQAERSALGFILSSDLKSTFRDVLSLFLELYLVGRGAWARGLVRHYFKCRFSIEWYGSLGPHFSSYEKHSHACLIGLLWG